MKICKKCKNHVANKAKICKKCGADVSKAKIIKNVTNETKQKSTKSPKKKSIKKEVRPIVESKVNNKNKVVAKNKLKQNNINNKEIFVNKTKIIIGKVLSFSKKFIICSAKILKKSSVYFGTEMFNSLRITVIIFFDFVKSFIRFLILVFSKSIYFIRRILSFIKNRYIKKKEARLLKKKELKEKQVIVQYDIVKAKKRENRSSKRWIKTAFISIFIISIISGVYFVGNDIYRDLMGDTKKVVVTEKATKEKVFSMNNIITYNNIDYKVVKIETSKGNNYKSPKAGHQFLIVTVYIKNNSGKKVSYSYENWTMSNSRGEEKKRIFTSINVETALYSGELVIGGIKTGSMVFEQPINDSKLKMNFYELKKDEDGNEVIDDAKRIFSISVKVPNQKGKQESIKSEDEVKVVKNNY